MNKKKTPKPKHKAVQKTGEHPQMPQKAQPKPKSWVPSFVLHQGGHHSAQLSNPHQSGRDSYLRSIRNKKIA